MMPQPCYIRTDPSWHKANKPREYLLVLGIIALTMALEGCDDPNAASSIDSWERRRIPGIDFSGGKRLPETQVFLVASVMESKAEATLSDASCIVLSAQQAGEYLGSPLPDMPKTKPYLVRAVFLNRETGHFFVTLSGDKLWVHHASLDARAVPMKRQALIVQLEEMPKDIFVDCSMGK